MWRKSVFIQNETAYIVMDFIEGETLLKKLQRGPMPFGHLPAPADAHHSGAGRSSTAWHYPSGHQPGQYHGAAGRQADFCLTWRGQGLDIQDGTATSSPRWWPNRASAPSSSISATPASAHGRTLTPWPPRSITAAPAFCRSTAVDRIVDDTLTCQRLLTQAQFDVLAALHEHPAGKPPQEHDRCRANGFVRLGRADRRSCPAVPTPPPSRSKR